MDLVHLGGRSSRSDYDDSPRSPRRSRKNSRIVPPHAPEVPGDEEPPSPPRRRMNRERSGYRERESDWDRRQDDEFLLRTPESRASSSSYHQSRPRYYDSGSRRDQSTTPSHSVASSMTSVATPHPPRSTATRHAPAAYRRPSTSAREPAARIYDDEVVYERRRSRSQSRPRCVMPVVPTPPQSRRASRSRAPSYASSPPESEDDHTEEPHDSEGDYRPSRSRRDMQLVRLNRDARSRSRAAAGRRDNHWSERQGMSVSRSMEEDREEMDFRDYTSPDERLRERITSRQPSRATSRPASRQASRPPSRPASVRHILIGGGGDHEHDADSEEPPARDRRDQVERREGHKDRHSSRAPRDHRRNRSESHSKRSPPSKRSSSKRYYESEDRTVERRDKYHPPSSSLRRSKTISVSGSAAASQHHSVSSSRRPSLLGSFFGSSHNGASHHQIPAKPPKLYNCVICLDERPARKMAKLKCGHRMCNSCLRRIFALSTTDPQHMPPKCCTTDFIPLKHVEQLFDMSFKKNWNKKFNEYSARNRVYCPKRSCGEFIRPEDISRGKDGKKVGKCAKCSTKVCVQCGAKSHVGRDCPKDEETVKFLAQAKDAGWQRCVKCKAMIELDEGCNHMTCRCGAEFCYVCGTKWKSCECPWFTSEAVEADRLQHMQIPSPFSARRSFDNPHTPPRRRPQTYEDELRFRHDQLEQDSRLARHLQDWREGDRDDDFREGFGDITALGNAAGHFMNEDFRLRPVAVPHPQPPQASAGPLLVDHPVAGDYVHGVNRARGVRANSMTRLAERFVARPPPPPLPTASTMPLPLPHQHSTMPPPPGHLAPGPQIRRHTVETGEMLGSRTVERPSGRVVRPVVYAEPEEMMMMTPAGGGGLHSHPMKAAPVVRKQHVRELPKGPVASAQAGLSKGGSYGGRVQEWLMYVDRGGILKQEIPT